MISENLRSHFVTPPDRNPKQPSPLSLQKLNPDRMIILNIPLPNLLPNRSDSEEIASEYRTILYLQDYQVILNLVCKLSLVCLYGNR